MRKGHDRVVALDLLTVMPVMKRIFPSLSGGDDLDKLAELWSLEVDRRALLAKGRKQCDFCESFGPGPMVKLGDVLTCANCRTRVNGIVAKCTNGYELSPDNEEEEEEEEYIPLPVADLRLADRQFVSTAMDDLEATLLGRLKEVENRLNRRIANLCKRIVEAEAAVRSVRAEVYHP